MISPRKLQQDPHELRVLWSDGHEAAYPYAYLRDRCPCAACRQGVKDEAPTGGCGSSGGCGCGKGEAGLAGDREKLVEIHLVGRYALQFRWQDGHEAGLYAFDLLRDICPCPPCAARPPVPG